MGNANNKIEKRSERLYKALLVKWKENINRGQLIKFNDKIVIAKMCCNKKRCIYKDLVVVMKVIQVGI